MDGNYTNDTVMGEEKGEEKQERIINFTFPRPDQTLYGPL